MKTHTELNDRHEQLTGKRLHGTSTTALRCVVDRLEREAAAAGMVVDQSTLTTAQAMSQREKGVIFVVAMVTANGVDHPYQSIVPLEQVNRETVIHQTGPAFFNGERLSKFGDGFVAKVAVLRVAQAQMDSSKWECIRAALDLWRQGAHALAFRRLEKAAQYAWGFNRPEWWK